MDYPAKLIIGIIIAEDCNETEVLKILNKKFGNVDLKSESIVFNFTDYYTPEMGDKLKRQWLSFESLISQDSLSKIKLDTINIENSFKRTDGTRTINLDPGYVTMHNLVLASTKAYSHRIYLGNDIYAELTLICKQKKFHPLDWTYADYRANITFFDLIRTNFKAQTTAGG